MMTSSVSRHQSKLQADRVSAGFAVVAGDNLRLMEGKMWVVFMWFEISHLRSPNLFKVSLCYPTMIRAVRLLLFVQLFVEGPTSPHLTQVLACFFNGQTHQPCWLHV